MATSAVCDALQRAGVSPVDFRGLLAGLTDLTSTVQYNPTLRVEDLYIVVELKAKSTGHMTNRSSCSRYSRRGVSGGAFYVGAAPKGTRGSGGEGDTVAAFCSVDCSGFFTGGLLELVTEGERTDVRITGRNPLHPDSEETPVALDFRGPWETFQARVRAGEDPNFMQSHLWESPREFAASDAMEVTARVHLFRRDDGRSVQVMDDEEVNEMNYDPEANEFVDEYNGYFSSYQHKFYFAGNACGGRARSLMARAQATMVVMELSFSLDHRGNLPAAGSSQECSQDWKWLRELRKGEARKFSGFNLTAEDEDELSRMSEFTFGFKTLDARIMCAVLDECANTTFNECFDGTDDMLVVLEGLDWQ